MAPTPAAGKEASVQHPVSSESTRPIRDLDELCSIFRDAEKPASVHLIGAEAEKFAVLTGSFAPMPYEGERGVTAVFERLAAFGWKPERETDDGPVIALRRGHASVTLEPGAQLELSGSPFADLHAVGAEIEEHYQELTRACAGLGLTWLSTGFHPLARKEELPWVPKQRYAIMRSYLPSRGDGAHDMMLRTATVQANYDYTSEEDALRKLVVLLRLSPLLHVMTQNAPFVEGRVSPLKSRRGDTWLRMDPARSGLIPPLWSAKKLGYRDYVEWALDAGMFLVKRGDRVLANTGQTFRSFMTDGFEGERATLADFRMHLNTLFPEVRLKATLEARACDAQSHELSLAVLSLCTGIVYDDHALAAAEELARPLELDSVERSRPALLRDGLSASIGDRSARELAEKLVEIARAGLARRARKNAQGADETLYLEPLSRLIEAGQCPADVARAGLNIGDAVPADVIVARTRLIAE
jgi:glutamate--cysteine ligase